MSAVPRVPIIVRSEAGIPTRPGATPLGPVKGIVIHHPAQGYSAASRSSVTLAEGIAAVKAAYASHRHGNGWNDLGYHILVDGAGRAYQGREYVRPGSFGPGRTPPGLALGAHVGTKNPGRIGVCVLGCFGDRGDTSCGDTPSPAALATLANVLHALCAAYSVHPSKIVGHRDLARTACPGDRLYTKLPGLRDAVAHRLAGPAPAPPRVLPGPEPVCK